jgi:addiction module toxin, RelE/StbE family
MNYSIIIAESAFKQLVKLPKNDNRRIQKAIDQLSENPRPSGVKKLKGSSENLYRVRVGDYRIIYAVDDTVRIVDVRKIGHRKDIYN